MAMKIEWFWLLRYTVRSSITNS